MEMRFVVEDVGSASALAGRLSLAFGAERISLPGGRPEVDVRLERGTGPTVIGVIETVERWLDQAAVRSAEMWLGETAYRVARWIPVEARQ